MRCIDSRIGFAELHDGTASTALRARIREHVASCSACAEEWAFAERLAADLAPLRAAVPPRVDVTARVMAEVASVPVPSSPRARFGGPWAWSATAAGALLLALVGTGWTLGPFWLAEAARWGGRAVAKIAAALPGWLATAGTVVRGFEAALRAVLPDPGRIARVEPLLSAMAILFCASALAASVVLLGREWRAAGRHTGVGS